MKNKPVRGFKHLIGETIKKVNAHCINVVTIECESGKIVELNCDEQHYGIGILAAQLVKDLK